MKTAVEQQYCSSSNRVKKRMFLTTWTGRLNSSCDSYAIRICIILAEHKRELRRLGLGSLALMTKTAELVWRLALTGWMMHQKFS